MRTAQRHGGRPPCLWKHCVRVRRKDEWRGEVDGGCVVLKVEVWQLRGLERQCDLRLL